MSRLSTVEVLGGGPAGLYTAILLRRLMPDVDVRVTEQNPEGATGGVGVSAAGRRAPEPASAPAARWRK